MSGCITASSITESVFENRDNDKDGMLTYEEYSDGLEGQGSYIRQAKKTGKDIPTLIREDFDAADANKDGLLSTSELKEAMSIL